MTYIYIAAQVLFGLAFIMAVANVVIKPSLAGVPNWWRNYRYYIGGIIVFVALLLKALFFLNLAYIQHFNTPILQL